MLYLNPLTNELHAGNKPSKYVTPDGIVHYDKLVHPAPEPIDEYSLVDHNVQNSDTTWGKWERDLEKVKVKNIAVIKDNWLESYTLPLETPFNFSVQQSKLDLDLWRDGIVNRAMELYNNDNELFTEEEVSDLFVGVLRGSVFEKIKEESIEIRDFDNKLHTITIEQARNIALLQAQAISTNFYKKWQIQQTIEQANSIEDVETAITLW